MDDRIKWAVVIVIVVAGIAIGGYYYYLSLPISADEYFVRLQDASTLSIVMDLRGAPDNQTRVKIMQCGVDFASSVPLGGKNITIYSMDDTTCIVSYPNESMQQYDTKGKDNYCLKEMYTTDMTIFIHVGSKSETNYFRDKLLISMAPDYNDKCGISYG